MTGPGHIGSVAPMQRVMIIGQPGSGKSTLARAVGEIAHLPVVHMDQIQWLPGWEETPRDERTRLTMEVHRQERWVFEGGHSATWEDRLARADTLIWLDLPVAVRLWRVTARTLQYRGRTRPDMPHDCPEAFQSEFYHFIWRTRHKGRAKMRALFDSAPDDRRTVHLTSGKAARGWVHALRYAASRGNLGISHR